VFVTAMATALVLFRRSAAAGRQQPAGGVADFLPAATQGVDLLDRSQPTAVFLVGGRNELAPFALRKVADQYSSSYRQILFLAVGPTGASGRRGGLEASGSLRAALRQSLEPYLSVARGLGLKVDCRVSTGTEAASGVARQADWMVRSYPARCPSSGSSSSEKRGGTTGSSIRGPPMRSGIPWSVGGSRSRSSPSSFPTGGRPRPVGIEFPRRPPWSARSGPARPWTADSRSAA